MACTSCQNGDFDVADVRMPCKVCQLNRNDNTVKRVNYCNLCKAYICKAHQGDIIARGIAAFKNLFKQ